ncbi:MAG: DUF2470 domain-containing protein [Pseudomonadota bacterium]
MTIPKGDLARVINHMNEDHGDALVLYAQAFAKRKDVAAAKMIDLRENALVLELADGEHLSVALSSPVRSAQDAHQVLVHMVKQGRRLLAKAADEVAKGP